MRLPRFLVAVLQAGAVLAAPAPALAQGSPSQTVEASVARAWLQRLHQAAVQRNYSGTQVFMQNGTVSSARVAHYSDGGQQLESVELLDGQMRRMFRQNDTVYTLWPRKQLVVVEQRPPVAPFPAVLQSGGADLFESYELTTSGADRQAGHEAEVYVLRPKDALRFAQRLWAEQATGLLLRADVLGPRGEVLESAAFSDVSIDVRPQPDSVLAPIRRLDGYRVLRPRTEPTQLEAEGWELRKLVAGFRPVSCVKRPLRGADADGVGAEPQVLHAVYSDGLTHVSLFVEPYDAQRHLRPMQMMVGATHSLMLRRGDWWITAVGDVPGETLKRFVAALERRRP